MNAKITKNEQNEIRILRAKSVKTGQFFKKNGFEDLSDVISYALKKSAA